MPTENRPKKYAFLHLLTLNKALNVSPKLAPSFLNVLVRRLIVCVLALICVLPFSAVAQAPITYSRKQQAEKPIITRVLFLLDGSGSMMAMWEGETRWASAKRLLAQMCDSLSPMPNVQVGLRVYGHRSNKEINDCEDTKLEVPFAAKNGPRVREVLKDLRCRGNTPIAYSLLQSAGDFPPLAPNVQVRNIIILLTDGIESCKGDPCAVALALQAKHIAFKPFIIGMGMDVKLKDAFECIGTYYNAARVPELKAALQQVVAQALGNTTAQISLMDGASPSKPSETNVPITMLDQQTGQEVYAFVHTLNAMGRPDTLLLDPSLVYKVVIHTIPSITLSNIRLLPGKHTVISTPAAQGDMSLSTAARPSRPIKAVIRQAGKGETLEAIELGAPLRLLTGKYDVELLTLPRIKFDGVEVKHGTVATRQIQTPGQVTFQLPARGVASLFTTGSKVEKIYTLPIGVQGETVQMQPGTYRLIYRSAGSTATVTSQEKTFKVSAGQTTIVKL